MNSTLSRRAATCTLYVYYRLHYVTCSCVCNCDWSKGDRECEWKEKKPSDPICGESILCNFIVVSPLRKPTRDSAESSFFAPGNVVIMGPLLVYVFKAARLYSICIPVKKNWKPVAEIFSVCGRAEEKH